MTYGFFSPETGADIGKDVVTILDGAGNPMFTKSADRFTLINELTAGAPSFSWLVGRPYKLTYFPTLNYITNTNIAPVSGYYYIARTTQTGPDTGTAGSNPSPRRRLPANTNTTGNTTDYYIVNADTGAATYIFSETIPLIVSSVPEIENIFFIGSRLWLKYKNNNFSTGYSSIQCYDLTNGFTVTPTSLYQKTFNYYDSSVEIVKYGNKVFGASLQFTLSIPYTEQVKIAEYTDLSENVLYNIPNANLNKYDSVYSLTAENNILWIEVEDQGTSTYWTFAYDIQNGTLASNGLGFTPSSWYLRGVLANGKAVVKVGSTNQAVLVEKSGTSFNTVTNVDFNPSAMSYPTYIFKLSTNNEFARWNIDFITPSPTDSGLFKYAYATTAGGSNTDPDPTAYPGGTPLATIDENVGSWYAISDAPMQTLSSNSAVIWRGTAPVGSSPNALWQEEMIPLP